MVIRSLFTGISSLQNHETRLDVISNNIANVNTTAYKNSRVRFEDIFSQTTRIATAPEDDKGGQNPRQIGLGQGISSICRDFSQGSLEITNKNTDIAIQGDGFFILKNGTDSGNFYTRAGNFELDRDGYLVNPSNGYRLQGWNATRSTITNTFIVDHTQPVESLHIELGRVLEAQATSQIKLRGNLNASQQLAIEPITVSFTKNNVTEEVQIRFEHMSPTKPYYRYTAYQKDASTGQWKVATHQSDGLIGSGISIRGILKLDSSGKVVGHWIDTDGSGEGVENGILEHTDEIPDYTSTTDAANDYGNARGLTSGPNGANDYFTIGLTKDAKGNSVSDPSNISVTFEEASKISGNIITLPDAPPSENWLDTYIPVVTQATETVIINGAGGATPGRVSHNITISSAGVNDTNDVSLAHSMVGADGGPGNVGVDDDVNGTTDDFTEIDFAGSDDDTVDEDGVDGVDDDSDATVDEADEVGFKGTDDFDDTVGASTSMIDWAGGDATNSYVRTEAAGTYTTYVGGMFNSPYGGGNYLDAVQLRGKNIIPNSNDPTKFSITVQVNGVTGTQVNPPGTASQSGFTATGTGAALQYYVDSAKGEVIFNQDIPLWQDAGATVPTQIDISYSFGSVNGNYNSGPAIMFTNEKSSEVVSDSEISDSPDMDTSGTPEKNLLILDYGNLVDISTTATPQYDVNVFIDGNNYTQLTSKASLNEANRQFFVSDPGDIVLIGDTESRIATAGGGDQRFDNTAGGGTNVDGLYIAFPQNPRFADGSSSLQQRQLGISPQDSTLYDIRVFVNGREYTQLSPSTDITTMSGNYFKVTNRSSNAVANGRAELAFADDIAGGAVVQVTYSLSAQLTISQDVTSGIKPVVSYEHEIDPGRWTIISVPDAEDGEFALLDTRGGTWVNNADYPQNFPQLGDGYSVKIETYAYDGRVDIIIPNGTIDGSGDKEAEALSFTPNTSSATPNRADSGSPVSATLNDSQDYQHVTTVEVYDSLGVAHNLRITFERLSQNKWLWSVPDPTDPSTTNPRTAGMGILAFDEDGVYDSSNSVVFESPADPLTTDGNSATVGYKGIYFDPPYESATTEGAPPPEAGADVVKIPMDNIALNGVIQNEGDSDAQVYYQNGFQAGRLTSFAFNENGYVTGLYSNGHSMDLARVALAAFNNPSGLLSEGQNMYVETVNSGQARIGIPGNDGRGSIAPGSLENSNVDLSYEFVDLIITQRGFQANSRVIRVADQVLQEILTLRQ
ncbi:MAG: flagellar hook-basal body complex protein [Candidatus Hydrogenedentota bacterium]